MRALLALALACGALGYPAVEQTRYAPLAESAAPATAPAATDPPAPAPGRKWTYDRFLRSYESPQFIALREMMRDPTTLIQLRRIAADGNATSAARTMLASADPAMIAMLRDQERRVRADPRLSQIMSAMQRVVADPSAPLPPVAADGLPPPTMSLSSMLGDAEHVSAMHALIQKAAGDASTRQRMAEMLNDPRVVERLKVMEAQLIEEPALLARLLGTYGGAPAPARRASSS